MSTGSSPGVVNRAPLGECVDKTEPAPESETEASSVACIMVKIETRRPVGSGNQSG